MADVTGIISGGTVTLDGTSQKISLKSTATLRQLLKVNGTVNVLVIVNGAGGAKVGNETINDSVHATNAQNAQVFISVIPGYAELYVKGTSTQTLTVFF
jgi:ClpP class serine protease